MNNDAIETPVTDGPQDGNGRKPRRRRAPPARRRPRHSEAMKRRWQDAKYRAKHAIHFAARRADATKAWSRKGIPDGYTRQTAALAKEQAAEKAKAAMAALKRHGLI